MNDELYQKKIVYENLLKKLNEISVKLETCHSNLFLYVKKKHISIDGKCYKYDVLENKLNNIKNNSEYLKNTIIPQVKNEYNEILYDLSRL